MRDVYFFATKNAHKIDLYGFIFLVSQEFFTSLISAYHEATFSFGWRNNCGILDLQQLYTG